MKRVQNTFSTSSVSILMQLNRQSVTVFSEFQGEGVAVSADYANREKNPTTYRFVVSEISSGLVFNGSMIITKWTAIILDKICHSDAKQVRISIIS